MKIIKNQDINNALKDQKRVYLVGDIKMPNGLEAIKTDGYEIGISDYKEDTFDAPHVHLSNDEYNYVLEGSVKIFLFKENKEYVFNKGDMYIISKGEEYAAKAQKGTKVIFSKYPGGNDKKLIKNLPESLIKWGASFDAPYIGDK